MEDIDRLGWVAGLSFTAYGTHLGIRVNDPTVLERLSTHLPPGWKPSPDPMVENLYSLLVGGDETGKGTHYYNLVYAGASRLARTMNLDKALHRLESHLQLTVAANSSEELFVHAGVVGWQGKAIVIPGRSFTGKTTLVTELLKAGATYYSDEYAIFDKQGQVWPYPRLLSIRDKEGWPDHKRPPEDFGSKYGEEPLPVGLVVVTEYQAGARWQARSLSPGRTMLAMLENTVAARSQPKNAMNRLQQVASGTKTIKSKRGEAKQIAKLILNHLS